MKRIFTIVLFIFGGLLFCPAQERESNGVDRYAIFVGSNIGGKNNQRLLYAGSDAIAFQKTMNEIGGIPKSNAILLLDPSKDDLDNAMETVSELIRKNREQSKRSEFLFYYSGHSDENALLLGNANYDYSGLKAAITNIPSDVHVVILDSCYSGNFIRTKGGQRKKPFLLDDSSVVKGHAYLSSSSSQEFSQESDEIGSSFFTNAMLTGLRGAADSSGDKKVTLNELYSYAFNETLSKTENTSAGPQHPNYNITLVGSGDLVLSDISNSECVLSLVSELKGRVIIRDSKGKLVSEINKTAGNPVFLAIEKGSYTTTLITETVTMQGAFTLESGRVYELSSGSLFPVTGTFNRVRGSDSEEDKAENFSDEKSTESEEDRDVKHLPFEFSIVANEFSRHYGKKIEASVSLALFRSYIFKINGPMLAVIGNRADFVNGLQAAAIYNISGEVHGAQGAGIFNMSDNVNGFQGAGIFNKAQNVNGAQGAGIFNYAENFRGAQGAGIFNISKDFKGVQAAAIANYARKLEKGSLQVGLVNIAGESEGFQIGLVNYSKNGVFEAGASYTTNNNVRFVFNSGNRRLYSVFGFSKPADKFFTFDTNEQIATVIMGLGTRLFAGPFNFDFEGMANEVLILTDKEQDTNRHKKRIKTEWFPSFRFSAGYIPVKHLRIFAGIMLMFDFNNTSAFDNVNNFISINIKDNYKIYPEFDFGVKFSLN